MRGLKIDDVALYGAFWTQEKIKRIEEEKMKLELYVADVVDDHKIKMDAMRYEWHVF